MVAETPSTSAAGKRGPKVPEGAGFFAPTEPVLPAAWDYDAGGSPILPSGDTDMTPTSAATQPHDCAASGHLYDDDWPWPDQDAMRPLAPGSRAGDPCIWCDHVKGDDE